MLAPGTRIFRRRGLLAAALLPCVALAPRPAPGVPGAGAAPHPPEACNGEAHRQFDFWRGSWEVHQSGEVAGHNRIRVVADGCGLQESWTGSGGGTGTSLNYYDPDDGRWHQLWVGSGGMILHLSGGLRDGDMVMTGERTAEGQTLRDRITWSPLPDGEIRQLWEVSRDDGESWSPVFDGRYRPE